MKTVLIYCRTRVFKPAFLQGFINYILYS